MSSFVHLHVHSEYSLLDGLARLPDLCQYAKECGMEALALTDHGQMYGMIKFSRAAKDAGIKPVYGCEVYQAPRSRFQREAQIDGKLHHLILLAENMVGYKNLLKLVSRANLEGFYYRPRVDRELLAEHAEGLICLSACLSGEVPALLLNGQTDKAREAVGWFKEVFGPDRYYLELQHHEGIPELKSVNQQLAQLAKEFDLGLVATNDVHYARPGDASAQDLLLAMQTNTVVSDPERMRMSGEDYYLRTPEEMARVLSEWPEALENTVRIAEQCDVDVGFTGYHLPRFDVPEPYTSESYLRKLCEEGLVRRYPEATPEIRERVEYELKVIHDMGFDDYMLINADLVHWAKHEAKMLVGPGRGSGPSSIVSYALDITGLEPLGLGLIFERFLNPGRVSMPDIDLDYPEDRRQEVIEYLTQKYGKDKTSQIATFGTMAARGAIRDVGRAMGIPLPEVDRVAKLIPFGPKKTIQDGLKSVVELKELYENTPYIKKLIDGALAVQGVSRHLSTHAAGVLITDLPLVEYTPLQRAPRGEGVIAQFCMEDVEEIGLLKLDVLGLSTLTILDRAFRWIEQTTGVSLSQDTIPLDDPEAFALLASGNVTGIFQVESGGMRRILRDMQATEYIEIVALLALYRPGPMQFIPNYIDRKFGREEITYRHPSLEPILAGTYGILVYQEQIIQIATELAGYTAPEADLMRRAVGKKKQKEIDEQHARFVSGAVANGIPVEAAEEIFADIDKFANYGFNIPHSAAYAVITLQTAYLKAHYPVQFMAALLSVERGNLDRLASFVSECRRLGIEVRPPDVNRSDIDFVLDATPSDRSNGANPRQEDEGLAIRFGLGAIKNVGDGPAGTIVEARGEEPFADLNDLASRVDLRQVNKRGLEFLIRAGALDSLGERNALLACAGQVIAISAELHRAREIGQRSLFDLSPDLMGSTANAGLAVPKDIPALAEKQRLADERELLGVYVSSHPLQMLSEYADDRLTSVSEIDVYMAKQGVQVAGVIDSVRVITTKKGDPMAFAQIEDLSGTMEVVVFPRTFELVRGQLSSDDLLVVRAKVDVRDDEPKLIAEAIEPYRVPKGAAKRTPSQASPTRDARHVFLEIMLDSDSSSAAEVVTKALRILDESDGDVPYSFRLTSGRGQVEVEFPERGVSVCPQLENEIAELIGAQHLTVQWA